MYENLVSQEISKSLAADIKNNKLPGSILFAGEEASGKLTAALETARILSCRNSEKSFICNCPSCLQQKSLICSNLLLLGPRDCFLEIMAAKDTFIKACKENASYIVAARYLFLRSIRKLTLRFNPILWEGESNLNKIAGIIDEINEDLEVLDFPRELPSVEEIEKICENLTKNSLKLESDYLYDSIPVNQIRNMENWCRTKSEDGKKTVIIENAERMPSGVRNALLKILEEPPADCVFILLTCKRNAIMQTILSRVRTYTFKNRQISQQKNVISRVFHNEYFNGSINDYMLTFLPVTPSQIKEQAVNFISAIANRSIPDVSEIVKKCDGFNPRIEFRLFLKNIAEMQRKLLFNNAGTEFSAKCMDLLRKSWDNVTLYNQTPQATLEILLKDISVLNVQNGGILKYCL